MKRRVRNHGNTPAMPWPGGIRPGHVALRRCVGCFGKGAAPEMRRFVASGDGELGWCRRGGRGAWLHSSPACEKRFLAGRGVVSSLRRRVDRAARSLLVSPPPVTGEG